MNSKLYPKNILMTVLLICAIGFSIWLLQSPFFRSNESPTSQPTTPDAFMTDVEYLNFDTDGQWSTRIQASHLIHYPKKDLSKLDNPKLLSQAGDVSWLVSADYGTTENGLEVVDLTNHVSIDKIHNTEGKTLSLRTSALTIWPRKKFAQTNQPITIIQPGSIVDAVGLTADLKTGDIHLLSNVKGSYESKN